MEVMPPETDLTTWTPAAIIFIAGAVGTLLGTISSILTGKGLEALIKWITFRAEMKEKSQKADFDRMKAEKELDKENAKRFSTEIVWEDRELGNGYKALLYQWDKRVKEVEAMNRRQDDTISEIHTQLMTCVQEHAEARIKANKFQADLDITQEKYEWIEKRFNRLKKKLHISDNDIDSDDGEDLQPASEIPKGE